MKLLGRNQRETEHEREADVGRPPPDEAPEPLPEQEEPRLADPSPTDLSKRDHLAIVKRAVKQANEDHITSLAAALAYYAFLAIPATLLIAAGLFGLVAGPDAITTVIEKLQGVIPAQASDLLESSLRRLTAAQGTSITLIAVGGVLALWSLSGAMQNVMWALNMAYGRDETRGFVRRRIVAAAMAVFALMGSALALGLLVLGPHLSGWVGNAVGNKTAVEIVWWVAQWPILIGGLLLAFAVIYYLGPNVRHPDWRFLSLGAVLAVVVWLLASGAFAFYASRFGSYNKAWGSLSAVVVMLTWLWISSVALLFGAEINAEAERSRELRQGKPAERELQAPAKT
ncbi:MAG TPA: YihY/virulence factor BrkB family protein [Gaiellaceae bacterium]|nr:YihY/virulence factor BrkB family protein [Gaiellaceae bacterium]